MRFESGSVRCSQCGAVQVPHGGVCTKCGAALLLDLIVDFIPNEERARFYSARALTGVGAEPLSYSEAHRRLGIPGSVVARAISSRRADELIELLESLGARCRVRAAARVRRTSPAVLGAVVAVLVLAVSLGAWFFLTRQAKGRAPAPCPVAAATASTPAATPAQDGAGAPIPDGLGVPVAPAALSAQKLAARALPSVATVRSGNLVGAGFFIDEELLLTNAHVVVPGVPLEVRLDDGRELLGEVVSRDDWTDLAKVKVVGAKAAPLVVGDSTRLEPGERVAFVGSPVGLEFTVHEGKVSFPGRNFLGLAYEQIDGSINPGNSGGPLLDARGAVVGIVSMKMVDGEGIGLALAIEYAVAPRAAEHGERWKKVLARVDEDNRREVERLKIGSGDPQLVNVEVLDGAVAVLVVEHWNGAPKERRYPVEVGAKTYRCSTQAVFKRWSPFQDALAAAHQSRRLLWMQRNGLSKELFVGAGALELERCDRSLLEGSGYLALIAGGKEVGRVPLDAATLRMARVEQESARRGGQAISWDKLAQMEEEQSWRERFRRARAKIEDVESRTRVAQRIVDAAGAVKQDTELPAPDRSSLRQARETLYRAREDLERATEELHELERQASFKAVPLEWRR